MRRSRCDKLGTRTAMTSKLGTRGLSGATRSFHTQANSFSLPLFRTQKANRARFSSTAGNVAAIFRTSAWVAIRPLCPPGDLGNPPPHPHEQEAPVVEELRRLSLDRVADKLEDPAGDEERRR